MRLRGCFPGVNYGWRCNTWMAMSVQNSRNTLVSASRPIAHAYFEENPLAGKTKSEMAQRLDGLQSNLRPLLKGLGYRVHGRTFNRSTADGLTQVVHFQMGPFDPPGTVYVPGLTQDLYGKFTVNLGVYVPEVAEYQGGRLAGSVVHEYQCCIRARLRSLGPDGVETWWELNQIDDLSSEISKRLTEDGLPFLSRFESRDAILESWKGVTANFSAGYPPRIVCAIVLVKRGRRAEARTLLSAQARETLNPHHPEHVRGLAHRLGLGELEQ